tara:strand:+ start:1706 stop:1918 length:213 start_codon:yes stop_codon:yes gene_type:complete
MTFKYLQRKIKKYQDSPHENKLVDVDKKLKEIIKKMKKKYKVEEVKATQEYHGIDRKGFEYFKYEFGFLQ